MKLEDIVVGKKYWVRLFGSSSVYREAVEEITDRGVVVGRNGSFHLIDESDVIAVASSNVSLWRLLGWSAPPEA